MQNKIILALSAALLVLGTYAYASNFTFGYAGSAKTPLEGISVHKFYDNSEGVVCYVYAPDFVTYNIRKGNYKTNLAYDANSAGSLSCVKR